VIYDLRYDQPWLLATDLPLEPLKALYQDRWPVEQIPLAAGGRPSSVRLGGRKPPSVAGTGLVGGFDPELPGRHLAGAVHRLLGPAPQTHPWTATAGALLGQVFSKFAPFAGANAEKGLGHRPSAQGGGGPSASRG